MGAVVEDVLQTRLELVGLGGYTSGLGRAVSSLGVFDDALTTSQRKSLSWGIGFGAAAGGIATGMARAVGEAGKLQQIEVGFRTILGSAEAARAKINELQDLAAQSPFSFAETARGAQQLLAMGVAAADVVPLMKAVGNATAAAGGDTQTYLRAIRALGQIKTKGVIQGDELLQLTEAGIPAVQILKDELGLTADQVRNIGAQGITSDKALEALRRGFDKKFAGAMAAQNKTLEGSFSNLGDSAQRALTIIGKPILDPTVDVVRGVTGAIDWFTKLPESARSAAGPIGVLLAASFGVLAVKSLLAAANLGKLATENVQLTNETLKGKRPLQEHVIATDADAVAHRAAAKAVDLHEQAEGRLRRTQGATGHAAGTAAGGIKGGTATTAVPAGTATAATTGAALADQKGRPAAASEATLQPGTATAATAGAAGVEARRAGQAASAAPPRSIGETPIRPEDRMFAKPTGPLANPKAGARRIFGQPAAGAAASEVAGTAVASEAAAGTAVKAVGGVGKFGKFLKGGPTQIAAAILAEIALGMLPDEGAVGTTKRVAQGAVAGAGTGALIGSIIPGLGTGVGAVIGGAVGAGAAGFGEFNKAKEAEKEASAPNVAALLAELQRANDLLAEIRDKDQNGVVSFQEVPRAYQLQALAANARGMF